VTLSEFGCEQVSQFDLAYLTLNFVIAHAGVEIMFKSIFTQELDKQFLGEICVSSRTALFNQQAGTARGPHERMMGNYSMQVGPETTDV